jgi:hypothetical protein
VHVYFYFQYGVIDYLTDLLFKFLIFLVFQIEALKAAGVTEVVLAINYQPEVRRIMSDAYFRKTVLVNASRVFLWLNFLYFDFGNTSYFRLC